MTLFKLLVIGHVITGLIVLFSFWVPIAARKGGVNNRRWGRIFAKAPLPPRGLRLRWRCLI